MFLLFGQLLSLKQIMVVVTMSEEFSASPVTTGRKNATGAAVLLLVSPAVLRSFVEASLVFVSIEWYRFYMIFLQVSLF